MQPFLWKQRLVRRLRSTTILNSLCILRGGTTISKTDVLSNERKCRKKVWYAAKTYSTSCQYLDQLIQLLIVVRVSNDSYYTI